MRLANRIRQQLWRYYPQPLELANGVAAEWVLEPLSLAPTPAKAARPREATLVRLLRRHRVRKLDAAGVLAVLRRTAITLAAGVTEAAVLHLHSLVVRLRLVNTEFRQAERDLDEPCARLSRDAVAAHGPCAAAILRSLPGVGTVTLATSLTEAGDPLARRGHAALRPLSEAAPVTELSGKTRMVVMRYAAQVRLRQAVFHRARVAIVRDLKSRGRYEALRTRGHSYGRSLRGAADRLLELACVLLRRQVLFDPDHSAPTAV